ncbi:MAG: alpha/beta fold hydrolase [Oceanicaulis sp.]
MTVLFIHGVPDTHRLWDAVIAALPDGDHRCLDMPGFGRAVPDGFSCTMDGYAAWLEGELDKAVEDAGGPVHLVGHDWGGLLVQRVAGLHPQKVASWTAGGVAIDEGYVWHDVAQIWQTPGAGEDLMAAMDAYAFAAALVDARVPEAAARETAAGGDDTMKAAILTLYRSAVTIGRDWASSIAGLGTAGPGLVLWGEHDPYASVAVGERLAARTGARFHMFDDCGHWWPLERAEETAAMLKAHWTAAG